MSLCTTEFGLNRCRIDVGLQIGEDIVLRDLMPLAVVDVSLGPTDLNM